MVVHVRNSSSEIVGCTLAPTGDLAWCSAVQPGRLRVWPGEEDVVSLSVTLPGGSRPRAGPTTIGVVARTEDGEGASAATTVTVPVVLAMTEPHLDPYAERATRTASYQASVANRGNATSTVTMSVRDPDGSLQFPRDRWVATCEPEERLAVKVDVHARRINWLGAPRKLPFTVSVEHEQGRASAEGVLVQTARLSRLMLVLVLLALGLIVPVGLIAAAAALFAEGTTRLVAVAVLGVVIAVVLAAWKWLRRG